MPLDDDAIVWMRKELGMDTVCFFCEEERVLRSNGLCAGCDANAPKTIVKEGRPRLRVIQGGKS